MRGGSTDTPEKQEARRLAKEARRKANQEFWADNPKNARFQWRMRQEAVAKVVLEDPGDGGSASLATLRTLMADNNLPMHRRIDAAEVVLGYELGNAALVGAAPDTPIAAASFKFLQAAASNPEVPEALRFRCLKSIAAIENARASKSSASTSASHRSLVVALVNAARRAELSKAGVFERAIAEGLEWAISAADEFDEPALPRPHAGTTIQPDGRGVGAAMHGLSRHSLSQKEHADEVHQALLAVVARNRPDEWRRLIREK